VVRGVLALAAAGFAAKVLSALYRILVARWLGAEAIGLYELAAPVLGAGLGLCGMGLPVATSALVAAALGRGDRRAALRLRRAARGLLAASGLAGTAAVALAAAPLARLLGNPHAALPLRAIAPGIAAAVFLSGEKAWLQATGRVAASALAVVLEQGGRVAAGLLAGVRWRVAYGAPRWAPQAAQAIAWAPAVGSAVGLAGALALAGTPMDVGPPGRSPVWLAEGPGTVPAVGSGRTLGAGAARSLLRAGLPNWLSGVVTSLATAVDAALVAQRLRASGWSGYAATAALGELNGMALPLASGPTVLFGALATAFMPEAARAWARGDREAVRRNGQAAYFWVLSVALPIAVGLAQFARPLCRLLYRNVQAAAPLGVLAALGAPLGVSSVAAALANAVGRPAAVVPGVLVGALVKTALVWLLTGLPGLGVRGAAWATLLGALCTAALNVRAVAELAGSGPPWRRAVAAVGPALAAEALAAAAAWRAARGWPEALALAVAAAAGAAAYGAAFWIAGRAAARRPW
jgi:O-antigen/teichoic acid export membrane protein